MGFKDDLKSFSVKLETRNRDVFTGAVDMVHDSIQNGSPITGAPGQQVDIGNLLDSWQKWYPDENTGMVATDSLYAPNEEDNISSHGTPITQRSEVGGPYSTALTRAGFQRIVDTVTAQVVGNDSGGNT